MLTVTQVMHTSADREILRVFQTRAQTRAFYNKISKFYDALSDRSEAPVRRAAIDLLRPLPGYKVLEIGFGTGQCLRALATAVGTSGMVCGIDLSSEMVKLARRNLSEAGLLERCKLRTGDAARLPYASASMDAVLMTFTLELFDTPEIPLVLAECLRVMRPGARIVVAGMSKEGAGDPLVQVFEWGHRHFPKFLDCRPIYVRRALESAGFMIERSLARRMWVPVEIVAGTPGMRQPEPSGTGRASRRRGATGS